MKLDSGAGFSVKDSTGVLERLRVDEATGNVSRSGALFVHTTGTNNLFVGPGAGNTATSGYGMNTAFGDLAMSAITTGNRNLAVGYGALASNTTGNHNSAVGYLALTSNTTAVGNSAFGSISLQHNTTGPQNSAFGGGSLQFNTTGPFNSAFGSLALNFNTTGGVNSAFGAGSLQHNTTGSHNSAFGTSALLANTTANNNVAVGYNALQQNNVGAVNVAVGYDALFFNTSASYNVAVGGNALRNAGGGGDGNTAVGKNALHDNTTGSRNVAVGSQAGSGLVSGSDNIYLANTGVNSETGQIKIGTVGTHTQTTIAGISGATSASGVQVLVNASGVLGTTTSSARFKQNVRDMDHAGDVLMKLRPVAFEYREDVVGAQDAKTTQYGLIAEEVAQVAPELVAPDLDGKPYSVKYHELPALLLSQVQQQQRTIDAQRAQIAELTTRLAEVERRIAPAR
ncbi:MAG TPA: tail fiber domain-containing protein [Myxococcota bacterium]|nr:tail fiber domain-containing protein [Myxococcota bacterium]